MQHVVERHNDAVIVRFDGHVGCELSRDGGVSPQHDGHHGKRSIVRGRQVEPLLHDVNGDWHTHPNGKPVRDAPADGPYVLWHLVALRLHPLVDLLDDARQAELDAADRWGRHV
eukprot:5903319-Pleurochrysis_carterae.AAC.1